MIKLIPDYCNIEGGAYLFKGIFAQFRSVIEIQKENWG